MTILDHLLRSIRSAAAFNSDVQVAPVCILWPDRDRQWESAVPRLQAEMPELFVLGDYAPDKRTGPAIWLRCVLAGQIPDAPVPEGATPVLYLPGFGRQDLRAVESCPNDLKPLVELQYRGTIWSQVNAKDWTILAWLKSDQGGMKLDVAQDGDAKNAMRLALPRLLDEDASLLTGKRLDRDYFNTLMTSGDPIRDLLHWLDHPEAFRAGRDDNAWRAFAEVCRSTLTFDPASEGALAGAQRLAEHSGPWQAVWERFCEAPARYPNIPAQIGKCAPPSGDLLWLMGGDAFDGWPQQNELQEDQLRRDLLGLAELPAHAARDRLEELEKRHGRRRSLVWAELGLAPLAQALEHLAALAARTKSGVAGGTAEDQAAAYQNGGWQADDAALRALAQVETAADEEAVTAAVRAVYLPWADDAARHFQRAVAEASYPGGDCRSARQPEFAPGDCVLFVDGLRFDVGKRLAAALSAGGCEVAEEPAWAALPSVTATGKPAVAPVCGKIRGGEDASAFEPVVAETGQSLTGGYHLKKLLADAGWTVLEHNDDGAGQGLAWCEFGDIDHEGHDHGRKLARRLDGLLKEIRQRVDRLLAAGWRRVRVVTDHGWLLLPGALPKRELPAALTERKWGRCAALKPGAGTAEQLCPWHWDPGRFFALADGVGCFKKGGEYAHGGLSLQECLTLHLVVSRGNAPRPRVEFADVTWKGLRCTVTVQSGFAGLSLDIRARAEDKASSVAHVPHQFKDNGKASVVVENEDLIGQRACLVLVDEAGAVAARRDTVIGGE